MSRREERPAPQTRHDSTTGMTDATDSNLMAEPPPSAAGSRRPYQAPAILVREPLEAMASTCEGGGAKGVYPVPPCNAVARS